MCMPRVFMWFFSVRSTRSRVHWGHSLPSPCYIRPLWTYEFWPEVVCHVGFQPLSAHSLVYIFKHTPHPGVISPLDLRNLARGCLSRWFSSSQSARLGRRVWSETRPSPIPSQSPPYNQQRKPRDPPFGTPLGLPLWPSYHVKKKTL